MSDSLLQAKMGTIPSGLSKARQCRGFTVLLLALWLTIPLGNRHPEDKLWHTLDKALGLAFLLRLQKQANRSPD